MVSHWSLSDSKSPQVPRTLLSTQADLSNAVVWMVFTRSLISKSSRPCTNPLVTLPSAPIPIGIIVTFMFNIFFFNSLAKSMYLSFFSLFFNFTLSSARTAKSTIRQVFPHFLLIITRSGCLAEIRWSVCISKFQRSLCVLFSRTESGLCIYHLFAWSHFNFLHNSKWITFDHQVVSNLILFLCKFRLLCDWSFRIFHHIDYICCFVASYLFLLWYDWFLRRCFVPLLEEILFPS